MRLPRLSWLVMAGLIAQATPAVAQAQAITASPPVDLSVTVYRSPDRDEGGFDLNQLQGFAFITETRRVILTPGEHRLRFEGVADGIEPASAIITGLPSGVVEKNRDAMLLSPSALIEAAQGQDGRVLLARTNAATGATTRTEGVVRSGADGGVVFETSDGIEALRCSGLAESFSFEASTAGLSATPTLSVLTRVTQPVEAVVQLSYLARGFDWTADYVADLSTTGKTMNLGGWITLANGNGVSFKDARVQIIAGKVNRESGAVEPIDIGQPILARCWPRGSTSDTPDPVYIERAFPYGFDPSRNRRYAEAMPAPTMAAMAKGDIQDSVVVTGSRRAEQEDLGDLKLYRVPDRTTIASRQSKQVRLLDQAAIPIARIYESDFGASYDIDSEPMTAILRTRNDKKNNLGLPLPSGRVQIFETVGKGSSAQRLLAAETRLRDLTIDEEVELELAGGPDIQVSQTLETVEVSKTRPSLPFVRGVNRRDRIFDEVSRIEVTNARAHAIQVELRLDVPDHVELTKADQTVGQKNGRPIFILTVPANGSATVRYQISPR